MLSQRALTLSQLDLVNDLIHDCWFNVSDVHYDRAAATIEIRFDKESTTEPTTLQRLAFLKKVAVLRVRWRLRIMNVDRYALHEPERLGRYDFNRLILEVDTGCLTVTTGIPLEFRVWIRALDIQVDESADAVERSTRWII